MAIVQIIITFLLICIGVYQMINFLMWQSWLNFKLKHALSYSLFYLICIMNCYSFYVGLRNIASGFLVSVAFAVSALLGFVFAICLFLTLKQLFLILRKRHRLNRLKNRDKIGD